MNVIVLDSDEKFLEFLDNELLEFKETHEEKGIRRCNISYIIQEINHAKELFKPGHKLWVSNARTIEDCLYVIPDTVDFNLYKDNTIDFYADEVLVELNFAFFKQTDLKAENGFTIQNVGNESKVTVNRNALEFWFGKHLDIGLIQDCLSDNLSKIAPTGTMTLMSLLRYIEEETSNIFVTRYEKDPQKNIIRRYLDFLNPSNVNNNWSLKVEFQNIFEESYTIQDEIVVSEVINNGDDIVQLPSYSREELNFDNLNLRILTNDEVLVEFPLVDVGLAGNAERYTFLLEYENEVLTLNVNGFNISSQVSATSQIEDASISVTSVESFNPQKNVVIPNGSVFEIVDESIDKVIYYQKINPVLGNVQPEILDLGTNVDDIDFEIDEADTYNAIAPILKVTNSTDSNALSRSDYDTIINSWINLSVTKGEIIPMIVERVYVQASSWTKAVNDVLGVMGGSPGAATPYNVHNNYWWKPLKQNNQIDESDSQNNKYEVLRATAYWQAPFSKKRGEIFVVDDTDTGINYNRIVGKPNVEKVSAYPKIGPVETSDEDRYAIFNDVCMKLKDKRYPSVNVKADIVNFNNGFDNNYKVYDTVFIKIPGVSTLVKAKIVKTTKNPKNVLENTVELSNYSISSKAVQKETEIVGSNLQLGSSNSAQLPFTLLDDDGNPLANKLVTFALYQVDESNSTSFVKSYMRYTNGEGVAIYPVNKFKPGNYTLNCTFGGDLIYSSSANSVQINVSGTKVVQNTNSKSSASKKSTTIPTQKVQTYYDQYGRSPDGKYIMAIGLPSAPDELSKYGNTHWEAAFINKCPKCGRDSLFWGYNFGTYFRGRLEEGSDEGAIYCDYCGAKYSIFGKEIVSTNNKYLTTYKKPVISSHNKAQTLKNGQRPYNVITETIGVKNITSTRSRIEVLRSGYPTTDSGEISESVRSIALSVVGDSTGVAAAKKIVVWVAVNIKNETRNDFYQSPEITLKRKMGNGCCQADLICQMCDAAGVMETVEVRYVHVHQPGTGHVFLRINGTWVDSSKKESPWGNYCTGYGSVASANITLYPTLPFERNY